MSGPSNNKIKIIIFFLLASLVFIPFSSIQAGYNLLSTTQVTPTQTVTVTMTGTPRPGTIPTIPPTVILLITINRNLQDFTKSEQDLWTTYLAKVLNIKTEQIHIIKIEAGSVKITAELPSNAASTLISMVTKKDPQIQSLLIIKVDLLSTPTPTLTITGSQQQKTKSATQTGLINRTPTKKPASTKASTSTSSQILTTFLLIFCGIFLLAVLGVGGFLLLKPGQKSIIKNP